MNLYPHQQAALDQTENRNRVAYYLDMGLGKTFIGSEKAKQLNRPLLVICQKSKIADWVQHLTDIAGYDTFDLTDEKEMKFFMQVMRIYPQAAREKAGVINYELAWRRAELLKLKEITLMLDESSLIQNSKAKQSKFILKLQPRNVILLSGTPTSGKYENLWTQARLLGWKINEPLYLRQYINFKTINVGGVPIKTVDKTRPYKNEERLKAKFREYGAIFMKTDEVFDLPKQTHITVNVPKTKAYELFLKNGIAEINGLQLIGNTTLTKMLYLRQLCGQYNEAKLEAFKCLLESTNDRLVVFYNFNHELELLKVICEAQNRPVSEVNGSTKGLHAYEENNDSVTLCQYQAASKGLNLQKANKIIYFTPTMSVENWMQSQKRIHRINQNRPCFYYRLTVEESIETQIYKALERGVDYTDKLFITER